MIRKASSLQIFGPGLVCAMAMHSCFGEMIRLINASVNRLANPVFVLSLVVLMLIWTVTIVQINEERSRNELELADQAANIAVAFGPHAAHTIGELDRVMLFARQVHGSSNRTLPWKTTIESNYLVNKESAQLSVVNSAGDISCFSFELVYARARDGAAKPAEATEGYDGVADRKSNLRILLAEDNPINRFVATAFLTDAGHTVRHAVNGRDAVELAKAESREI